MSDRPENIVAYRYKWKDALTWAHSTTEPARHPNLIVEPLCVAGRESEPLKEILREVVKWHGLRGDDDELLPEHHQSPEIAAAIVALEGRSDA